MTLAKQGVMDARVAASVQLRLGNCRDWRLPEAPDIVITNPPWGKRLGGQQGFPGSGDEGLVESEGAAEEAWGDLRVFLKEQCPGAARLLSPAGCPTPTRLRQLRLALSVAMIAPIGFCDMDVTIEACIGMRGCSERSAEVQPSGAGGSMTVAGSMAAA